MQSVEEYKEQLHEEVQRKTKRGNTQIIGDVQIMQAGQS